MWALGLILFELTTKTFPMSNIPQIFDDIPLEIPDDVPPLIKTLLEQLLNKIQQSDLAQKNSSINQK